MSVSGAVVKDDNLHRRPKRAPVTLPAACGFRLKAGAIEKNRRII
jgi:hypothetical protein